MGSIYILGIGKVTSPWKRDSRFDKRYIRFTADIKNAGKTSDEKSQSHTHEVSTSVINNSAPVLLQYFFYDQATQPWAGAHNHTWDTIAVEPADNLPKYYQLQLWSMDMDTWENIERRFPQGAVLMSQEEIHSDELAVHENSYDHMIRLGDDGPTGGSSTHQHGITGKTKTDTALAVHGYNKNPGSNPTILVVGSWPHMHTAKFATSAGNSLPDRISTRLYYAVSETSKAEAGVVCFTDEEISENWTAVDAWDGFYLASANENATSTKGSMHTHTASGSTDRSTSHAQGSTAKYDVPSKYDRLTELPHVHDISSTTINPADSSPPYVLLYPIRLKKTLGHVITYDTELKESVSISRRSITKPVDLDVRVGETKAVELPSDILFADVINKLYDLNAELQRQFEKSITKDLLMHKIVGVRLPMGVTLAMLSNAYDMSLRIIKGVYPQGLPVLDSMMKGWVDQIQHIDYLVQVMYLNNNLDYATGADLDDKWGDIYEVLRLANESDDHYRKRIKSYVLMQTGSGTKETLETVIDTLIGEQGATTVNTRLPGKIEVQFKTGTALHLASENRSLLDYMLPSAVAAGIQYTVFTPFCDILMDIWMSGALEAEWYMDYLKLFQDLDESMAIDATMCNQWDKTYDMLTSMAIMGTERLTRARIALIKEFNSMYTMSTVHKKSYHTMMATMFTLKFVGRRRTLAATCATLKTLSNVLYAHYFASKARNSEMYMAVTLA